MPLWFVWPLAQALLNSLHPNTPQGIDAAIWTLDNYRRIPDPLYDGIMLRTLRISLIVTVITALLAYPVATCVARLPPRLEALVILAYVSPGWSTRWSRRSAGPCCSAPPA